MNLQRNLARYVLQSIKTILKLLKLLTTMYRITKQAEDCNYKITLEQTSTTITSKLQGHTTIEHNIPSSKVKAHDIGSIILQLNSWINTFNNYIITNATTTTFTGHFPVIHELNIKTCKLRTATSITRCNDLGSFIIISPKLSSQSLN